jgi:hypothetical protein
MSDMLMLLCAMNSDAERCIEVEVATVEEREGSSR